MNEEVFDEKEEENVVNFVLVIEIDDDLVKEVIENWDFVVVDFILDEVFGKRLDGEKEVEDFFDEVIDMIEILFFFQWNCNLIVLIS